MLELAAASKAADCTGFDLQAGLYLVVVTADRKVDMKVLAGKLGLSGANFRFADAVALKEKLGVEKGAASALAVMNDAAGEPRLLRHATPQPPRLSPHASAPTPQLPRISRHASAATPQLPASAATNPSATPQPYCLPSGDVKIVLDKELMGAAGIGCHPLRNDTTCVLTPDQLLQAQSATRLSATRLDPVRPS